MSHLIAKVPKDNNELYKKTFYKAFHSNFIAMNDFQYEVGKTFTMKGMPIICKQGFHACDSPIKCLMYYRNPAIICEVQLLGAVINDADKFKVATNKIKIVRQLSKKEQNAALTGSVNYGNTIHTFVNGGYHSINDKPSCNSNRCIVWHINDKLHRDGDKPATVSGNYVYWYKYGVQYIPSSEIQLKYRDSNGTINLSAVMNGH
jgi:hypothetical protein